MDERAQRSKPQASVSERERSFSGREALAVAIDAVWPARARVSRIGGLPRAVAGALPIGGRDPYAKAAESLDGEFPGWIESAARAICEESPEAFRENARQFCTLVGRRPVKRPEGLLRAAEAANNSEVRLWLLCALANTDTPSVRAFWLSDLRRRIALEPKGPDVAAWFAFLRAFLGGWLSYADFRDCLAQGSVLAAADKAGDYPSAVERLGLSSHPTYRKWYRQVVYEVAHQPDVSLSWQAGGWVRDFPGEDYLWDALSLLSHKPNSWWPLHVLRWASGVDGGNARVVARLKDASPTALGLVSLLRPDLCDAVGEALGQRGHGEAVAWLRSTAPRGTPDLRWIEQRLRPWATQVGHVITTACEALCLTDPPDDFEASSEGPLRRLEFVRDDLAPDFIRLTENLSWIHALRRECFDALCWQARKGLQPALRALAFWPERVDESAPILFRLARDGTKRAQRAAKDSLEVLRARANIDDLSAFEKRLDLASAWSDAGLEGKPARIWWDVAGYRVKLSVAGGRVNCEVFSRGRRLASIPKAVRADASYGEIKDARKHLARKYRYFRRRLEEAMVDGVPYSGRDFSTLLGSSVVRSLVSRLVLLVDGTAYLWPVDDPFGNEPPPAEIVAADTVGVAHPIALAESGILDEWQQRVIEERMDQPFKQVFREAYVLEGHERQAYQCERFAEHPLVARRAFALLRSRGYFPRSGDAMKERLGGGLTAHIHWAREDEDAGRLLAMRETSETVTSGAIWFTDAAGEVVALSDVDRIVFSETARSGRGNAGDVSNPSGKRVGLVGEYASTPRYGVRKSGYADESVGGKRGFGDSSYHRYRDRLGPRWENLES